jgi:bifunctional UDP-N-acetylglucosamine pyrophosphorylase/glucosamine-1-phosphate N-acetyltransferase
VKTAVAPHVLILVAGTLEEALQPVFRTPVIRRVLDAAVQVPRRSLGLVVGPGEREQREKLRDYEDLRFFPVRAGAGGAEAVLAAAEQLGEPKGGVLVLSGSAPLITRRSIEGAWARHLETGAACGADGLHAVSLGPLLKALRAAEPGAGLADALKAAGLKTADRPAADPDESIDAGDPYGRWKAELILRERFNRDLMLSGVALQDPRTTFIDPSCRIERGALIEGGVIILNSIVGAGCTVKQGSRIDGSRLGRDCVVGPYAHLRPGTTLDDGARVGNFVEIKNSSIGAGTKVSHLSYIGDAEIGRSVNIGCGFITCNSDGGPVKHRTIIEDGVFIGSGSQAIAPVRLGAGSFIATGSSVTDDVPPDAFVISRGRQVTKPGYAKKYGKKRAV